MYKAVVTRSQNTTCHNTSQGKSTTPKYFPNTFI